MLSAQLGIHLRERADAAGLHVREPFLNTKHRFIAVLRRLQSRMHGLNEGTRGRRIFTSGCRFHPAGRVHGSCAGGMDRLRDVFRRQPPARTIGGLTTSCWYFLATDQSVSVPVPPCCPGT